MPDLIDLQFNFRMQDYLLIQNSNLTNPPKITCFRPGLFWQPVAVSSDCDQAVELVFREGDLDVRLRWTERQTWWSGSAVLFSSPAGPALSIASRGP